MMTARRRQSAFSLLAMVLASCSGAAEKLEAEPPVGDGWSFSYVERGRDEFPSLDLRSLNEPLAGQSGFVRLSPDGNSFVLGDGTPVRFWAIGSEMYLKPDEELKQHVKFLARMGVNMVRLHAQLTPPKSKLTDVNEQQIDGIWRFVAAAKLEGIYVTISPYWSHPAMDASRWGIEGYAGMNSLYALLFFDEILQKGYKAWATALYARPNPYTQIRLADDPAVAIIQIQNEDSLLFWTTDTLKPAQKVKLGIKFGTWLAEKYGSLEAAKKAWNGASNKEDDFAAGKVGLLIIWELTQPSSGQRSADQLEFYATLQRRFYQEMGSFYRETLHCRQLINASNWKTANQTLLDDAERWTYTANDVIAVNRYYNGGVHEGPDDGWRIDPGDKFTQTSALLNPRELPINLKQVVGHPMIISESTWVSPLAFQSEGPFLSSIYQSLTGVDVFYWFVADEPQYKTSPHFPYGQVKGQNPLMKWSASIPAILGGFPANALLFRKGYVKTGETVVHEERTLKSIWDRQPPLLAEDPSFDPNRDKAQAAAPRAGEKFTAVDPLAFLVGPVEVKYEGDPTLTRVSDLSAFINHQKKQIKSNTGEIAFDYNIGLCTLDAPKAQGACGFLKKADLIKLSTLSIRSANTYATILAVALDDQPLASSKKILIQIGTANRPTNWSTKVVEFKDRSQTRVQGYEVVNTGGPPWRIADSEFGISLKNPGITRATLLNPAGYAVEDVPITRLKSGVSFNPPTDTMYLILE